MRRPKERKVIITGKEKRTSDESKEENGEKEHRKRKINKNNKRKEEGNSGVIKGESKIRGMKEKREHQK